MDCPYKIDLENFKKTYKDATEIDFYKELIYTYGMFLNFSAYRGCLS